eukprot:CAMPEP_0116141442 /NCGR_PEP_ID=MMETSP0329-20121206/14385_1 /TAXON_ID=697910 /ORGANISM="Pseudo-nitzschia arenysensis, Strain B593" /LENGTH=617 /DNA_ID=CAMNT_0003636627 /DNA_START=260 /DNA_END=2110 /DNA_ORIENTATION=-
MAFDYRCIPNQRGVQTKRKSSATACTTSNTTHIKMMCLSLLLLLLLLLATPTTATISFIDTGRTFSSRQDTHIGQPLLDGYEYMGRLQWVLHNPTLCPGTWPNQKFDIVSPSDGLPVALVAEAGGCTIEEKVKVASSMINPANVVGYLIVQDERGRRHKKKLSSSSQTTISTGSTASDNKIVETTSFYSKLTKKLDNTLFGLEETAAKEELWDSKFMLDNGEDDEKSILVSPESLEVHFESAGENGRALLELPTRNTQYSSGTNNLESGLGDINLALLHVSYGTGEALRTILTNEDIMDKMKGGPRVLLNGRGGSASARTVVFWMLVTFSMCACGCACLLICVQTGFEDEPEPQAPRRPTRRKLTIEEVRARFPSYHFNPDDHTQCCPADGAACEAAAQQNSYMELSDECTICLDEFVHGVRVRKLPCGHVFHSTCIARWLIERSAVCPLCKMDLFIEPEEEDESSSDDSDTSAPTPPAFWNSWFTTSPNAYNSPLEVPSGAAESAPLLANGDEEEPRSWWPFSVEIASNEEEEDVNDNRPSPLVAARNLVSAWTSNVLGSQRRRRQQSNEMGNLTELTEPLVPSSSSLEEQTPQQPVELVETSTSSNAVPTENTSS